MMHSDLHRKVENQLWESLTTCAGQVDKGTQLQYLAKLLPSEHFISIVALKLM